MVLLELHQSSVYQILNLINASYTFTVTEHHSNQGATCFFEMEYMNAIPV